MVAAKNSRQKRCRRSGRKSVINRYFSRIKLSSCAEAEREPGVPRRTTSQAGGGSSDSRRLAAGGIASSIMRTYAGKHVALRDELTAQQRRQATKATVPTWCRATIVPKGSAGRRSRAPRRGARNVRPTSRQRRVAANRQRRYCGCSESRQQVLAAGIAYASAAPPAYQTARSHRRAAEHNA